MRYACLPSFLGFKQTIVSNVTLCCQQTPKPVPMRCQTVSLGKDGSKRFCKSSMKRTKSTLPKYQLDKLNEVKCMSFERSFNEQVKEGKEYELEIKETSRQGDGVARIKSFVIFVPHTKPGDHVKIKINSVRARFAIGAVIHQNFLFLTTQFFGLFRTLYTTRLRNSHNCSFTRY